MFRRVLSAALVGLGLMTGGAAGSFAQGPGPLTRPVPPQPALRPAGLLVTQVLPGTTAARQGIEPGDVIVGVNGNPVRSLADLNQLVGLAGRVAQLDVIDCRTGWLNPILVYPHNGLIGVVGVPAPGGVQPIPPVYPPWRPGGRPIPLPLPVNPAGQPTPLPLPAPGR
jgi:membrane-associated protease RseP (regulator of RpoE activity)